MAIPAEARRRKRTKEQFILIASLHREISVAGLTAWAKMAAVDALAHGRHGPAPVSAGNYERRCQHAERDRRFLPGNLLCPIISQAPSPSPSSPVHGADVLRRRFWSTCSPLLRPCLRRRPRLLRCVLGLAHLRRLYWVVGGTGPLVALPVATVVLATTWMLSVPLSTTDSSGIMDSRIGSVCLGRFSASW